MTIYHVVSQSLITTVFESREYTQYTAFPLLFTNDGLSMRAKKISRPHFA